jgi:hypothetical protein
MTISELITYLEHVKSNEGDLNVYFRGGMGETDLSAVKDYYLDQGVIEGFNPDTVFLVLYS